MHAGTVDAELGLRHKSSVQTVASCDGAHRHLEGHDIVRSMQRLIVSEIDLMLRRSHLMMGCLDDKSHVLQVHYDVTAGILTEI